MESRKNSTDEPICSTDAIRTRDADVENGAVDTGGTGKERVR